MTSPTADEADGASEAQDLDQARGGRGRWALLLIALVGVVVLFVGANRFFRLANGVEIEFDAEPLRCQGTTVQNRPAGVDDDFLLPMAVAVPGMSCQFRFFVANTSGTEVTIERVRLPFLGPDGGPGVRAVRLDPIPGSAPGPLDGERDAVWAVSDPLLDGERLGYTASVEFRPGGCTPDDGSIAVAAPVLEISAWGTTRTVEPRRPNVGFIGSEASSCDE